MNRTTLSILLAAILIAGAIILVGARKTSSGSTSPSIDNVSVVDGKQIIEISAKGGYFPKVTLAQKGVPTLIKVGTKNTFDCSAALVIPSLGYRSILPSSGEILIDVPPQESGAILQGLCAMGMYNFQIKFN